MAVSFSLFFASPSSQRESDLPGIKSFLPRVGGMISNRPPPHRGGGGIPQTTHSPAPLTLSELYKDRSKRRLRDCVFLAHPHVGWVSFLMRLLSLFLPPWPDSTLTPQCQSKKSRESQWKRQKADLRMTCTPSDSFLSDGV